MQAEKAAIYEIQSICTSIEGKRSLLGVKIDDQGGGGSEIEVSITAHRGKAAI
jgi:hypothetical protein